MPTRGERKLNKNLLAIAVVVLLASSNVRAAGELKGDGNVIGDVGNSGLVSPGTSTGALHVDGDYTQTVDAELLIELASGSNFDQLLVTGTALLDGSLEIDLLDGFAVSGEQFLPILIAANVMGEFDSEILPTVPNVTFDVVYNPTSVVLHIVAPNLAGDYNGDGTVDTADYVVWRKNDGTQDGYDTWRANFGRTFFTGSGATTTGSASANPAIPEPSTLVLLAFGGALSFVGYRRIRLQQVGTQTMSRSLAQATLVARGGAILRV